MFAPRSLLAVILLSLYPLGSWAVPSVGFRQAQQYPVGTAPRRVAIGDFNGDHTSDLAVCNLTAPALLREI
jgi:hypothetical protein